MVFHPIGEWMGTVGRFIYRASTWCGAHSKEGLQTAAIPVGRALVEIGQSIKNTSITFGSNVNYGCSFFAASVEEKTQRLACKMGRSVERLNLQAAYYRSIEEDLLFGEATVAEPSIQDSSSLVFA